MDFVVLLSKNRSYLMGMAIIMILMYHAVCWTYNPFGIYKDYNIGYVGVDVFMFLSGFGLVFSYKKNSIWRFYYNRLKRVYPVYALAVIFAFVIIYKRWSGEVLLLNLATLGYYINHGIYRFDWYAESLFLLYLAFPLFNCIGKHLGGGTLYILSYCYSTICIRR